MPERKRKETFSIRKDEEGGRNEKQRPACKSANPRAIQKRGGLRRDYELPEDVRCHVALRTWRRCLCLNETLVSRAVLAGEWRGYSLASVRELKLAQPGQLIKTKPQQI